MDKNRKIQLERFEFHTKRDEKLFKWRSHPYFTQKYKRIFDIVCKSNPRNILDVGCGEGIDIPYLPNSFYVGVDLMFERLKFASEEFKNFNFVSSDVCRLPFLSCKFDLVFCHGLLHHLSNKEIPQVMAEMIRVCKNEGQIAFIEPNPFNLTNILLAIISKAERGIFYCSKEKMLKYLNTININNKISIFYDGSSGLLSQFIYMFMERSFICKPWFVRFCNNIDDNFIKKILPNKFWSDLIIIVDK